MMRLPTLRGLFDEPDERSEIEMFLKAPLQTNPDLPDDMPLAYARLGSSLAQLEALKSNLKLDYDAIYLTTLEELRRTVDEVTQKPYSIDGAERIMLGDKTLIELKRQLIECTRRMGILKSYIRAIEMKSRHTPGEQGLRNREFGMEAGSNRQKR